MKLGARFSSPLSSLQPRFQNKAPRNEGLFLLRYTSYMEPGTNLPQDKNVKLATKCAHVDRPEKAKGMCQSCYRAAKKAEEIEKGGVKLDEESGVDKKTGLGAERDLASDPEATKRFYQIMWTWLEQGAKADEPIITTDSKGKAQRDFRLEARLRESVDQRAMKAATVLGRAYIAERHVEEKPEQLMVDGISEAIKGWGEVIEMKVKGKKADA